MRRVRREVVPEMLEVDALASLHKRFGRWSIEAEMPDAGIVVNCFPSLDARKEGIHEDKFASLRRELRRICVGNHQSDIVPNHLRLPDAQRSGQSVNADRRRSHIEAIRRNRRFPDPRQIGRDHGESLGESGNGRPPHRACFGKTVQQDQGGPSPAVR